MREYLDFYYNGISSKQMGLINVSVDNGLFKESFISSRKINTVAIKGNDKPYFMGVQREPLQFSLEFAFVNPYDKELISEVAKWLDQDYYRELYFTENPDRRFMCMPNGDLELIHNGLGNGYIQLNMICDSPYSYSQTFLTTDIDFTNNTSQGIDYSFLNIGHVSLKPEMWIKKVGDGDIAVSYTHLTLPTID
jgi:predicted phage tail component-like protein